MKKYSLLSILLIYCLCSLATLLFWNKSNFNGVTGDEPHYLVMANGIGKHASLEQTTPYKEAFDPREFSKFGIPPDQARLSPENMHTIEGPHGYYNMHNIGLPLLLALPFVLGGIVGAKLFMMFCGGLAILFSWKISGIFSAAPKSRWLAVLATCIAMPLVPAANQIYPDILAGVLSMIGLYWFHTTQKTRGGLTELLLAVAVVYLPWLQIKFGLTCAVIVLAVATKIYIESKDMQRVARIFAAAGISCLTLAAYNFYAFGKVSGPYTPEAIEISKTGLMVLLGLHFDQNQGFLMQNPVNLIGLLAIGWFYRAHRPLALLWTIVFLSLLVPNALHPNWYGGWCFSGRFGWAAAIVFMIPTIYGLVEIAKSREKVFHTIVSISVLLQVYLFCRYAFKLVSLYNRGSSTPFSDYSLFYSRVHTWLPGLYNSEWAYSYAPNYAWLAVASLLLIFGFLRNQKSKRLGTYALWVSAIVVLASGYHRASKDGEVVFQAASLPSLAGRVQGSARIAEAGVDHPGLINFGPYVPLTRSKYKITLKYSSSGPKGESIAVFDIFNATAKRQLLSHDLPGTNGLVQEFTMEFEISDWSTQLMEFRNNWTGKQQFKLYQISVMRV